MCGALHAVYQNEMPHSGVRVQLDRSGRVTIFSGTADVGQGSNHMLACVVAERLGIQPHDCTVIEADTDLTPVDLGSYSSRVTLMMGNAAIEAAQQARDLIARGAAKKLDVPPARLVFSGRRVFDVEDSERGLSFREAICEAEAEFKAAEDARRRKVDKKLSRKSSNASTGARELQLPTRRSRSKPPF
jgi:CO/xanthine dehydrogenase Mo-binding subunit